MEARRAEGGWARNRRSGHGGELRGRAGASDATDVKLAAAGSPRPAAEQAARFQGAGGQAARTGSRRLRALARRADGVRNARRAAPPALAVAPEQKDIIGTVAAAAAAGAVVYAGVQVRRRAAAAACWDVALCGGPQEAAGALAHGPLVPNIPPSLPPTHAHARTHTPSHSHTQAKHIRDRAAVVDLFNLLVALDEPSDLTPDDVKAVGDKYGINMQRDQIMGLQQIFGQYLENIIPAGDTQLRCARDLGSGGAIWARGGLSARRFGVEGGRRRGACVVGAAAALVLGGWAGPGRPPAVVLTRLARARAAARASTPPPRSPRPPSGDEAPKLIAFKEALGLGDEEAAPVFIEVRRRCRLMRAGRGGV